MKTRLYPKTSIAIVILASFCVAACQQIPDVEEFLADVSPDVSPDEQPNFPLPTSETANCYIVSSSGAYELYTVKGNSSEPVGEVSYAEVLWESFGTDVTPSEGDLISSVSYSDGEITFTVPSPFKEGNAVIAARDAAGSILWSWHIWLTDTPAECVYANNAGTMMDRNLGATSATPGDVGALGLLYQWGRKDPFLGSSSISEGIVAKSTCVWPKSVSSDFIYGTIEFATSNPTVFITRNEINHDWYYPGVNSTDDTRWKTSDKEKSIYDPCPTGWRVADGGEDGVWAMAGFLGNHIFDNDNLGILYVSPYSNPNTWYPAAGGRSAIDNALTNVGSIGQYHSATTSDLGSYGIYFFLDNVYQSYGMNRAIAIPVRCRKE